MTEIMNDRTDFDELVATLEVLANPQLRREIERGLEDVAAERVDLVSHHEVKRRLGSRQ